MGSFHGGMSTRKLGINGHSLFERCFRWQFWLLHVHAYVWLHVYAIDIGITVVYTSITSVKGKSTDRVIIQCIIFNFFFCIRTARAVPRLQQAVLGEPLVCCVVTHFPS